MPELLKEVSRRLECLVVLGDNGDMAVGGIKAPCVQETELSRDWDIKPEALVVVQCWSNVVTVGGMRRP
jgi:hypothetical protein